MNRLDLWDLRERLEQANILICFNGPLSQSIIEQLGVAIRRYLQEEKVNDQVSDERLYDVFAVYIELTQNISSYAQRQAAGGAPARRYDTATVAIGKQADGAYLITAGNTIDRADLPPLVASIDSLAAATPDELKERFKEQRRRARAADSSSAGLGLIDMSRKASRPLEYHTREIDADTSFFYLTAVI